MSEITINKKNALAAFKNADAKGKALLTDLLGQDVFSGKIIDRIKSFSDACAELGVDPEELLPYPSSTDDDFKTSVNAYVKLATIIEALNEGWVLDFRNVNEAKYYPWFTPNLSGLGLSFDDCDCDYSFSTVGSRLVLRSRELAEYVGQEFIDIYNEYSNNLKN